MPDFYEVLGVSRDADAAAIRQAFKKLALSNHPDKVAESERAGAETRFKVISEAYEVLINEESRILYDAQSFASADWQDFYSGPEGGASYAQYDQYGSYGDSYESHSFFADSTPYNPFGVPKRTEDAVFDVKLSLEDVFFGKMVKLKVERHVVCRKCEGSGGRPNAAKHTCAKCHGFGTVRKTHLVGPETLATSTVLCDTCHGEGHVFHKRDLCRKCRGTKTQTVRTMIEVYLPKGIKNRHRVVLPGLADEAVGQQTGDLVIMAYCEASNGTFKREGADLYASARISLREALTGFSRPLITHMDGRQLKPTVPRGDVLDPGSILRIPGEGLVLEDPASGQSHSGDLYLAVEIEFPTNVDPCVLDKVARLLGPSDDSDGEKSDDTLDPKDDDEFQGRRQPEAPVSDVAFRVLREAELPEYAADANDEPERNSEPPKEKASYGASSACVVM